MTMRRVASLLFLFLGGFGVGMQVMVAFFAIPGGYEYARSLAYFSVIAAAPLAIGTWLSPGRRWRELGLAVLIGAAVCVGSFSVAIFFPDEQGVIMDRRPLAPFVALAPGLANLLLVTAAGLWLYLRGATVSR